MLGRFSGRELSGRDAVESAAEQAELPADVALLVVQPLKAPGVRHHIGGVAPGLEQG